MAVTKTQVKKVAAKKATKEHPTFKEMIVQAIVNLKDKSGSSRQAIKKYIHANYKGLGSSTDNLVNTTIKKGVEAKVFTLPKGPSGPVKISSAVPAKKPVAKTANPKKAASSDKVEKKTEKKKVVKKAPVKKAPSTPKKVVVKKAAVVKKTKSPAAKKVAEKKVAKPKTAKPKVAAKPKTAAKPKKEVKAKTTKTKSTPKKAVKKAVPKKK